MEADKTLSIQMGIRLGEKVLKLKRLRMADGIPMMVERSYLPARLFISLKRPLLEQKPLYDVIEQDYQRAKDYKIVKDIINRYHKDFIDSSGHSPNYSQHPK